MKSNLIILAAVALITCTAAEAGPRSRTVIRTGPNGNSAVTSRVVTPARHGHVTHVTGPQGAQWSRSVVHGRYGHFNARQVTGPNGNTRRVVRIR